jgi:hypothetical protein
MPSDRKRIAATSRSRCVAALETHMATFFSKEMVELGVEGARKAGLPEE